MSNTPSPAVEVTQADRDAATALGQLLGVPDITGPRNQDAVAKAFARHRLTSLPTRDAAIEEAAKQMAAMLAKCAARFREYQESHEARAKEARRETEEFARLDKAARNRDMANQCEAVLALCTSALSTPTSGEASAPPPLTEDAKTLSNLAAEFRRWIGNGPNYQPHYPGGMRPFSTGDLKHLAETLERASASPTEQMRYALDEARFLLSRIDELDWCGDFPEQFLREWDGHVEPPLSRLRRALERVSQQGETR